MYSQFFYNASAAEGRIKWKASKESFHVLFEIFKTNIMLKDTYRNMADGMNFEKHWSWYSIVVNFALLIDGWIIHRVSRYL